MSAPIEGRLSEWRGRDDHLAPPRLHVLSSASRGDAYGLRMVMKLVNQLRWLPELSTATKGWKAASDDDSSQTAAPPACKA